METSKDREAEFNTLSANKKVFSALLFVVSFFMSHVVNQTILLVHVFPSHEVLGLGQVMANVLMIWIGCKCRLIKILPLNKRIARHIMPLPLTFLGRIVVCLATRGLEFPLILIPLRQLTVMMTLILEKYVLGITASFLVQSSVMSMVEGALILTLGKSFFWSDYIIALLTNIFLASHLVYLKKILDLKIIGMCGLLYYNSLFRIVLGLIVTWSTSDLARVVEFEDLKDVYFLCHFFMSCVLDIVLSFSMLMCVKYNSALTTAVIETFTRIVLCYFEILYTKSYVIVWTNYLGLTLSVFGSILYTYATYERKLANFHTRIDDFKV